MNEKMTNDAVLALLKEYDRKCNDAIIKAKETRDRQKQSALNQWAYDNARFNVGDIICANDTIIQVQRRIGQHTIAALTKKLYVKYRGLQLTKKLQPRKDGQICDIYDDGREIKIILPM